jgi:DNA invertase Pin-like site-specific DNA recombinase
MKCVLYARVANDDHATNRLGAQLRAMRRYAARRGLTVEAEFVEPDGSPHNIGARPALERLLKRCRANPKIDEVVVTTTDRLSRSLVDFAHIRYLLQRRGVAVASVANQVDATLNNPMLDETIAAYAQLYRAVASDAVRRGLRAKRMAAHDTAAERSRSVPRGSRTASR